jgi:hypothetical protein
MHFGRYSLGHGDRPGLKFREDVRQASQVSQKIGWRFPVLYVELWTHPEGEVIDDLGPAMGGAGPELDLDSVAITMNTDVQCSVAVRLRLRDVVVFAFDFPVQSDALGIRARAS